MSKHTPGPWKFIDIIGCCAIETPSRQLLKYISPTATNVANARLMAAAPDLLEALEEFMAHGEQAFGHDFDVMIKARAAIAKAIGET